MNYSQSIRENDTAFKLSPTTPSLTSAQAFSYSSFSGSPTPISEVNTEGAAKTTDLEHLVVAYLSDCELRLYSPHTIETRRVFLKNFLWFLDNKRCTLCGVSELRQFFHYLMHGHEEPGGRFGNKNLTRAVRPVTVMDYYTCLRSLFDWLVAQRIIGETPFAVIAKPQVREEVKTALSAQQISALLQATSKSADPTRNAAILALLLDTGCRASELISIHHKDLDLVNRRCRVLGKGDKYRMLFLGQRTAAILA